MSKTALICGISGQDGAYLAELLLGKGYNVHGTSRDAQLASFSNLEKLSIKGEIECHSMALNDFRSVIQVLTKIKPDEVYNLSGQSSVGLSFEQPVETLESISLGTLNILEAIRFIDLPIRFYNAGSGECFGHTDDIPAVETAPFRPRSPYAVAKSAAHWEVANYRDAYNLFACSGILFNHESPLRPNRFVTKKIILAACRIARGQKEILSLGNISIARDWGWAPEYVNAMWSMLQQSHAEDYIIATGSTHTLEEFIEATFSCVGLNWRDHVKINPALFRPSEIMDSRANPSKALLNLGWKAKNEMDDVVRFMVEDTLKSQLRQGE